MPTINERSSFVEEAGLFFETLGMTRMSGRILGYLMVTDKDMVSFDELTQVLQASKTSISTNIKACIHTNFVKPITFPGDRKTYHMLSQQISWVDIFRARMQQLNHMVTLMNRGLDLRSNHKDPSSQWLLKAIEFYEWILKEFPILLEKWEDYVKNKTS